MTERSPIGSGSSRKWRPGISLCLSRSPRRWRRSRKLPRASPLRWNSTSAGLKIRKVGDEASYDCPLPQATEGVQYHPALPNVGVNARYLSEILRRFPADGIADIRIQAGQKSIGPLRVECPERPEFIAVLMPVKI